MVTNIAERHTQSETRSEASDRRSVVLAYILGTPGVHTPAEDALTARTQGAGTCACLAQRSPPIELHCLPDFSDTTGICPHKDLDPLLECTGAPDAEACSDAQ